MSRTPIGGRGDRRRPDAPSTHGAALLRDPLHGDGRLWVADLGQGWVRSILAYRPPTDSFRARTSR
jgi:hypothetical protein